MGGVRSFWGYPRLCARARKIVEKISYQEEKMIRLLREVINENIR